MLDPDLKYFLFKFCALDIDVVDFVSHHNQIVKGRCNLPTNVTEYSFVTAAPVHHD